MKFPQIILVVLIISLLIFLTSNKANVKTEIIDAKDGDEITLSADKFVGKIGGKSYDLYGYNGITPGPLFKLKQGDEIKVNFKNNLDEETTIHWHGLRHDVKDDGVPDVSQESVKPGESFTYNLNVPDAGIYWYHPHIREDRQQDLGLAGNILVVPEDEGYFNEVNREEVLVLDDILVKNDKIVPFGEEYANHALMGRYGNVMLVNGEIDYKLDVSNGEVVRFYITNVANARPFKLIFEGAKVKLIGSDISNYQKEEFIDELTIAPAERYIVEVMYKDDGNFKIKNVNPSKKYNLASVNVVSRDIEDFSSEFNTLRINDIGIEEFREYLDKDVDYELDLTMEMTAMMEGMGDVQGMPCHMMIDGTMMGDCGDMMEEDLDGIEWEDEMGMMNAMSSSEVVRWILKDKKTGKENMNFKMNAKIGDKIKIRLFNDPDSAHPMQHPIHLHGQRFLALNGNENLVWKDTVLVPKGSTVDILVDVTNPGEWMFHCHIAEHLEAGMMMSFMVDGENGA
jgi:suppressor of ftsI